MKAAIRLLVRFFFWFALVVLAASILMAAHGYVTGYDPDGTSASAPVVRQFLRAVSFAWVPGVLLAGLIALFSAGRSGQGAASGLLALWATWTVLLVLGGFILPTLPSDLPTPVVLPERSIVRVGAYRLYAVRREADTLSPLVVHDAESPRRTGFSVVAETRVDPLTGLLALPGTDGRTVDLRSATNSYPALVRAPEPAGTLAADVDRLPALLAAGDGRSLAALLNLGALSLYLLGCWTLVRLTRWPLFNALFALGALRLAVWLIPAVQLGALRGLVIAAFDSSVLPFASAAILAILALGLLAVLVFLPPLREWRAEVTDA